MKTSDMIQLGALAVVGFLAYQQFAKATPAGGTSKTSKPPLQPSKLAPVDIPPDFGFKDPNSWDDTQNVSTLTDLLGSWL